MYVDVHRQGVTLQLLLGRGTEYLWQLWIPLEKGWREDGAIAAGLRDCWSRPSRTGWWGINFSADRNWFKFDNRKLFEFFLISRPHEHLSSSLLWSSSQMWPRRLCFCLYIQNSGPVWPLDEAPSYPSKLSLDVNAANYFWGERITTPTKIASSFCIKELKGCYTILPC